MLPSTTSQRALSRRRHRRREQQQQQQFVGAFSVRLHSASSSSSSPSSLLTVGVCSVALLLLLGGGVIEPCQSADGHRSSDPQTFASMVVVPGRVPQPQPQPPGGGNATTTDAQAVINCAVRDAAGSSSISSRNSSSSTSSIPDSRHISATDVGHRSSGDALLASSGRAAGSAGRVRRAAKVLSRSKRYVAFPEGSSFSVSVVVVGAKFVCSRWRWLMQFWYSGISVSVHAATTRINKFKPVPS